MGKGLLHGVPECRVGSAVGVRLLPADGPGIRRRTGEALNVAWAIYGVDPVEAAACVRLDIRAELFVASEIPR